MAVGCHILATLRNVQNYDALMNVDALRRAMRRVVDACNLHVVSETGYQFEPAGATYVYVLSESHFSAHTYYETNTIYVDVFCCSPTFSSKVAIRALQEAFQTDEIESRTLMRS